MTNRQFQEEYSVYVRDSYDMGTTPMDYDSYEEFMMRSEQDFSYKTDGAGYAYEGIGAVKPKNEGDDIAIDQKEGWNG